MQKLQAQITLLITFKAIDSPIHQRGFDLKYTQDILLLYIA